MGWQIPLHTGQSGFLGKLGCKEAHQSILVRSGHIHYFLVYTSS